MKVQIIGNPIAGGGKAPAKIKGLADALIGLGCQVETFLTQKSGDARQCAEELNDNIDRVVVVGGDGTLNEVINGLSEPFKIPLTQLPMGTANIIARDLGLHRTPDAVANTLVNGKVRKLDLFVGNGRRFLAVGSVGLDATVTRDIMQHRKGALGARGYVMPILRSLLGYHPPKLSIQIDDHPPIEGGMVVIGNIRNYAAFFHVTERARPDSGHLDICIFPQASPLALICYASAASMGMLGRITNAIHRTGQRVTISSEPSWPYELDGDYVDQTPLQIEVRASVLPFII